MVFKGVNFHGIGSAKYQNRETHDPPQNYIDDSFRIFADGGIRCLRVPYYWESYELDNEEFYQDLDNIANAADKYDIQCIYDNHQWFCSSWIGNGIGMPNSIMSGQFRRAENENVEPKHEDLIKFWNGWWDNQFTNKDNNTDGWKAQLLFIKNVIKRLDSSKSTLGFEIFNEPQIFRASDYVKVGRYHQYMVDELKKITNKQLFFCFTIADRKQVRNLPLLEVKTAPKSKGNIVYDYHLYPPNFSSILYCKIISLLMGNIPVYIGEFNSGFQSGTNLNEHQIIEYLQKFKPFNVYGWALWQWSYHYDQNIPAFNLTQVVDNKIRPNSNFNFLVNCIKNEKL